MIATEIEKKLLRDYAVSRETANRLETYVSELLKWQKRINLIGPSTIDEIWTRHIFDSLHLLSFIKNRETSLLDMGSGAGLPGLVMAIAGMGDVTLVESDQKKAAFLREAARLTNAPLIIQNCRVEELPPRRYDIVTARALAPLGGLFDLSECFTDVKTICLFPKGKNYSNELEDAKTRWDFDCIPHPGACGSDGFVLEIRRLTRLHPS